MYELTHKMTNDEDMIILFLIENELGEPYSLDDMALSVVIKAPDGMPIMQFSESDGDPEIAKNVDDDGNDFYSIIVSYNEFIAYPPGNYIFAARVSNAVLGTMTQTFVGTIQLMEGHFAYI